MYWTGTVYHLRTLDTRKEDLIEKLNKFPELKKELEEVAYYIKIDTV